MLNLQRLEALQAFGRHILDSNTPIGFDDVRHCFFGQYCDAVGIKRASGIKEFFEQASTHFGISEAQARKLFDMEPLTVPIIGELMKHAISKGRPPTSREVRSASEAVDGNMLGSPGSHDVLRKRMAILSKIIKNANAKRINGVWSKVGKTKAKDIRVAECA